jgi:hypothetical protein
MFPEILILKPAISNLGPQAGKPGTLLGLSSQTKEHYLKKAIASVYHVFSRFVYSKIILSFDAT